MREPLGSMLSRVQTASQRQALWEWPICSVTPGKRFISRYVLFWPTAKLATGLAPAGAAGHATIQAHARCNPNMTPVLACQPHPPGRSSVCLSVCLAAGEVLVPERVPVRVKPKRFVKSSGSRPTSLCR